MFDGANDKIEDGASALLAELEFGNCEFWGETRGFRFATILSEPS
jgi:hypothetical protein